MLAYSTVVAFEVVSLPTVAGYVVTGLNTGYLYTIAGWDLHLPWVLVGIAGAVGIAIVNYFGIRLSSFVQGAAATTLFLVGLAFFIPGNVTGDTANLAPRFVSVEGFFCVVIMTPFLFLGFDVVPQVAEEIKIPFRTVGKLMLVSIVIAMTWYVLVRWSVGLNLDASARETSELATADAMAAVYASPWGARALIFGGLLGINHQLERLFHRRVHGCSSPWARGGMLPAVFARLHPRYDSPIAVIILLTAISTVAPWFGRQVLVWLVDASGLATVLGYFLVTVSFLRLRKRYPDLERPYQVPAPKLVGE